MKAIVRKVSSSFEKALAKYFGSGPTDLNEAISQHEAYVNKLVEFGVSVKVIHSHSEYPDCCFVEDHAIVAGDSALLTNVGHDSRLGERKEIEDVVISGGDMYRLKPSQVLELGNALLDIPHIRRFRFATKGIAIQPMKILTDMDWTDAVTKVFERGRKMHKDVVIHTHFNTPNEVTGISQDAMNLFLDVVNNANPAMGILPRFRRAEATISRKVD